MISPWIPVKPALPIGSKCGHQQAEPVVLLTGEIIATICIECLIALPADYIDRQRITAERKARCAHEHVDEIVTRNFADHYVVRYRTCADCGTELPLGIG
jgi:hypothetical protein